MGQVGAVAACPVILQSLVENRQEQPVESKVQVEQLTLQLVITYMIITCDKSTHMVALLKKIW